MTRLQCVLSALLAVGLSATAMTMPTGTKDRASTRIPAQSDDFRRDHSISIFVSATEGNDHWSGRLAWPNFERTDGPLTTFDHAREVVQSIDKTRVDRVRAVPESASVKVSVAGR